MRNLKLTVVALLAALFLPATASAQLVFGPVLAAAFFAAALLG